MLNFKLLATQSKKSFHTQNDGITRTLLCAALALGLSVPASALTINGRFDGSNFSATPYYTCGPGWNCADPASHSAPVTPTAQWVINTFNAAASYWEQRISDPWTVTIDYGFSNLGSGPGTPMGVTHLDYNSEVNGRYTAAEIAFNSTVADWFLSPNPGNNDEFQPFNTIVQAFAASEQRSVDLTTGVYTAAIPYGPDSVSSVLCNGEPCGAHQDLLRLAIHEIAHALNLDTRHLTPLNTATVDSQFGLIEIPNGPLAGTTIPWTTLGGGHTFLKPAPGADYMHGSDPIPTGYLDPRMDAPSGQLATNGVFFYGSHRGLISDMDAVVIASVSDFKRVNLGDFSYVALPNFKDTTTLSPEQGALASLLTLNGAATLSQNTNAAGVSVPVLRLTPDLPSQAGSAFLTKPFQLSPTGVFESKFGFKIGADTGSGEQGSDGFAFVMQSDVRGPNAIGSAGEGLGYGINLTSNDLQSIGPSLAIEFDTHKNSFDPNGNHISYVPYGQVDRPTVSFDPGFTLNDGLEHFAWVDYDSATSHLALFLSNTNIKPATSVNDTYVEFNRLWGADLYFGFTAGTGDGSNYHDILEWDLQVGEFDLATVPEPASLSLMLAGFAGIVAVRRRRQGRVPG